MDWAGGMGHGPTPDSFETILGKASMLEEASLHVGPESFMHSRGCNNLIKGQV